MGNGLGRKLLPSLALGIVVALIVGAVAVLFLGRPPRTIHLAAGQAGGMYAALAESLRLDVAAQGYRVEILATAGSVENADLLRTGQVDIGLVQSGTELLTDMGGSSALAEVFYEPFWLFARASAIPLVDGVPGLAGKRVSIGPAGDAASGVGVGAGDQVRPARGSGT
jgi:TRAP-type uncharacterized transport system substrate-binding protein